MSIERLEAKLTALRDAEATSKDVARRALIAELEVVDAADLERFRARLREEAIAFQWEIEQLIDDHCPRRDDDATLAATADSGPAAQAGAHRAVRPPVSDLIRLLLPDWMNLQNIEAIAAKHDWALAMATRADNIAEETIWQTQDGATFISYVRDFGVQLHYVVVQGPDREPIAEALDRELPLLRRADVLAMAQSAQDRNAWIAAVYHAAICSRSDRHDPELAAVIEAGLAHDDSEVRRAAVFACTYASWRSLEPSLRRLAKGDAVDEVRAMAQVALDSLERHVWSA